MSLQESSMKDLKIRRGLLLQIIKENPDDDRIDEPKRQLELIEDEIKSREERPEDLTVGLATLKLDIKKQ
jgi:hypothetical protein